MKNDSDKNVPQEPITDKDFRLLFERMDQGFCVIEKIETTLSQLSDYRYIITNPAFEKHTGLINVKGKTIRELIPDIGNALIEHYDRVIKTGQPEQFTNYISQLDLWIEAEAFNTETRGRIAVLFTNVTKRKKIELALQESEKRLTTVFAALPVGVGFTEPDGRIVLLNKTMEHYLPNKLMPSKDKDNQFRWRAWDSEGKVIKPENFPGARALRGEIVLPGLEMLHTDTYGNETWTFVSAMPVTDDQGKVIAQLCVITDIDKLKRTSEALQRREQELSSLITASSELVYRMSGDWKKMYTLTGKNFLKETISSTDNWIQEYIPPEEHERVWSIINQAINEKKMFELEHRVIRSDGTIGWTHSKAVPILNDDSTISEWVGAASDISQRIEDTLQLENFNIRLEAEVQQHTAELKQSRELLQATLDSTLEMIQVFKAVRNKNNNVIDFTWILNNAASEKIYGDVIGKRLLENNPGVIQEGIFQKFIEVLETGVPQQYERHYAHEQFDGWFYQSVVKLDDGVATSTAFITERKVAEIELEKQRLKYTSLVENTPDVITRWDKNLKLVFANSAFIDKTGTDLANLLGKTNLEMGQPDDVAIPYMASLKKVFDTGEAVEHYNSYPTPHGEVFYYSRMVPEKNAIGEPETILAIARDISALKSVERQVQESQFRLQSIFDTSLVQMSILQAIRNKDGEIEDFEIKIVNKELEKVTGRKDLVGKMYAKEFPGIHDVGIFDLIVKTIETDIPQQMEYYYPHEGFNMWFACMFVKFGDGVVATNLDITARKQAEEERYKNFKFLEQSEQVAGLGSWDYDYATKTFSWSDGMYKLFNLGRDTHITPGIYIGHAYKRNIKIAERIAEHIRSGKADFEETIELDIDEQKKTLHIKASVLRTDSGEPIKMLGVDWDITALHAAERKIRKMEAAQQREIVRASLTTLEEERHRISESLHNGLGQLLYGIKISLSNFTQQQSWDDFQKAKQYTNQLLTQAIHEARRISHELMPPTLEDFGLKTALEDICRQLQGKVKFKTHFNGLQHRLEKYLELAIYRTLQELMTNVIKHADATEANVEITINPDRILLKVSDNGQGIKAIERHKPGIGLASIRTRIKLLNGYMNIDSEKGKGTTIEITIPVDGSNK